MCGVSGGAATRMPEILLVLTAIVLIVVTAIVIAATILPLLFVRRGFGWGPRANGARSPSRPPLACGAGFQVAVAAAESEHLSEDLRGG